jgi:hypothetical protein
MVIAALASFALLLIAWIVAPDRQRAPTPEPIETAVPEVRPVAA